MSNNYNYKATAHLPRVSEDAEQQQVMYWARVMSAAHPELNLLYHVPNEGKRSKAEASRQAAMGLKSGVSDLVLPAARGGYHGLYIELKAIGGKASDNQIDFLQGVQEQGYAAAVCYGAEDAIECITAYIKGEDSGHFYDSESLNALRPKHRAGRRLTFAKLFALAVIIVAADILVHEQLTAISFVPFAAACAGVLGVFYKRLMAVTYGRD